MVHEDGFDFYSDGKNVSCRVDFKKPIRPVKIGEYEGEKAIFFSDKSFIYYTHAQDCCEYNYADFDALKDTSFFQQKITSLTFARWEGGLRINNYSINCYSEQNGYYSNEIRFVYCGKDEAPIMSLSGVAQENYC